MPQLSLDILINVLSLLPVDRDPYDDSIKTLTNCLRSSTLLREAAIVSSIWKPHYLARYIHFNEETEAERRKKYDNCWRLMYSERRRLDALAIELLQKMVTNREDRTRHGTVIAQLGLDVWDALDLTAQMSVPPPFQQISRYGDRAPRLHALPLRYWAQQTEEIIVKRHGYQIFYKARNDEASFEETMTSLSCFFGVPPTTITRELERLTEKCRVRIGQNANNILDPTDAVYDVVEICKGIVQFMLDEGFGPELRNEHHYRAILNHFPHAYLDTHKHTIPISLSHVFIAIATRLGIQASPVNFPSVVLIHIQREHQDPFFINVFVNDVSKCIVDWESNHPVPPLQAAGHSVEPYLNRVGASSMLHRAALNIRSAAGMTWMTNSPLSEKALQAALCAHMLFGLDNRGALNMMTSIIHPLDCGAFFLDAVLPTVEQRFRDILTDYCNHVIASENSQARLVKKRGSFPNIKYFAGMPLQHKAHGYLGYIAGWDETCEASEEWIMNMGVDILPQGRIQPFYTVFADDGTQRYVAEENIEPIPLNDTIVSQLVRNSPEFGMYFEDVVYEANVNTSHELKRNGTSRGRFVLTPQSRFMYPDDEEFGNLWITDSTVMDSIL